MIVVICDSCHQELQAPGGLLFGVPDADGNTEKLHLCVQCTDLVMQFIAEDSTEGD